MSLEKRIEELTVAVLALTSALQSSGSTQPAAEPKPAKVKAEKKQDAEAPAAPAETAVEDGDDREAARALLVKIQTKHGRDRAISVLTEKGGVPTIGKVPTKNLKGLIAECRLVLDEDVSEE